MPWRDCRVLQFRCCEFLITFWVRSEQDFTGMPCLDSREPHHYIATYAVSSNGLVRGGFRNNDLIRMDRNQRDAATMHTKEMI